MNGILYLVDQHNAADYLRGQGWLAPSESVRVDRLAGGVSNEVLYVARGRDQQNNRHADFVVKQARGQLRTADPWFCSVERIWREMDVLNVCADLLRRGSGNHIDHIQAAVPAILHEDRENYLFVMSAAPADHRTWKQLLLAPDATAAAWERHAMIADACGSMLGQLHARAWDDSQLREQLADRQIFVELRLTPYYRALATAHPSWSGTLRALIEQTLEQRLTLVHADFSPKNLLVAGQQLLLVDFETGHFGDPAFDLGFFLSHLVLKAFYHAPAHEPLLQLTERFWQSYHQHHGSRTAAPEYQALLARAIRHFAACMWARLDGVSKIEYLPDESCRQQVRELCQQLLQQQPATWDATLTQVRAKLQA